MSMWAVAGFGEDGGGRDRWRDGIADQAVLSTRTVSPGIH